eukprot:53945-Eustigmatos_ZCMA.PRE.1
MSVCGYIVSLTHRTSVPLPSVRTAHLYGPDAVMVAVVCGELDCCAALTLAHRRVSACLQQLTQNVQMDLPAGP